METITSIRKSLTTDKYILEIRNEEDGGKKMKDLNVTENRNLYIGGSDMPIILNLSSYKTRFELLIDKLENRKKDITNEYIEYGNKMESKIRDFINKDYDYKFLSDSHINKEKKIRCNVDGVDVGKATILEIKTTTKYKKHNMIYLSQLYLYMLEHNCEYGILAIYNTPEDFNEELDPTRLVIEEYSLEDLKNVFFEDIDIYEIIHKFWKDHDTLLLYDTLGEELHQGLITSENIVDISDYVVKLEKELKVQKKVLYELMDKEGLKNYQSLNGVKITRVMPELCKIVTVSKEKLKDKYPSIFEEITKESSTRRAGYIKVTIPKELQNE